MTMSMNDARLLDRCARHLRQVSDWLSQLDYVQIDGSVRDSLGEVIFAVDEALEEEDG